eukprot:17309_1
MRGHRGGHAGGCHGVYYLNRSGRLGLVGGVEDGWFGLVPGAAKAGEKATDEEPQKPQKTKETEKGLVRGGRAGASSDIGAGHTTLDAVFDASAGDALFHDTQLQAAKPFEAVPRHAEASGRVRGNH